MSIMLLYQAELTDSRARLTARDSEVAQLEKRLARQGERATLLREHEL